MLPEKWESCVASVKNSFKRGKYEFAYTVEIEAINGIICKFFQSEMEVHSIYTKTGGHYMLNVIIDGKVCVAESDLIISGRGCIYNAPHYAKQLSKQ